MSEQAQTAHPVSAINGRGRAAASSWTQNQVPCLVPQKEHSKAQPARTKQPTGGRVRASPDSTHSGSHKRSWPSLSLHQGARYVTQPNKAHNGVSHVDQTPPSRPATSFEPGYAPGTVRAPNSKSNYPLLRLHRSPGNRARGGSPTTEASWVSQHRHTLPRAKSVHSTPCRVHQTGSRQQG